ncbi:response regulator [Brevundimonas sp. R86498]|uniref:response regulator n=1 Tax=Brevundimonas sp. R86498 TaxID=3093845 RepID=UPI0037CCA166
MDAPVNESLSTKRVLLVDDDRLVLMMMTAVLERLGHMVVTAQNGAEAYALIRQQPDAIDVVLADRMMPLMDGLGLTRRLKREAATRLLPVILLTGQSAPADQADGLAAGAFYYLPKPVDEALLDRVIKAAIQEHDGQKRVRQTLRVHQTAFTNLQLARFTLERPDEVEGVASLLASMAPDPERAFQGLSALIANAVEHGLYQIGRAAKEQLVASGGFQAELQRRAPGVTGVVEASGTRKAEGIHYLIKDPGPGFAWRQQVSSDPSTARSRGGRGVARAAVLFDSLAYNAAGNTVAGLMRNKKLETW